MIAIHTTLTGNILHRDVRDVGFLLNCIWLVIIGEGLLSHSSRLIKKEIRREICAPIHNNMHIHLISIRSSLLWRKKRKIGVWRHELTYCLLCTNTFLSHAVQLCLILWPTNHWCDYTHRSLFGGKYCKGSKQCGSKLRVKWSRVEKEVVVVVTANHLCHWFLENVRCF